MTFTASVPEQDLLETFSESGDNPGSFATCAIPASTATVQGIGTFSGPGLTCVIHNFESSDTYQIGDGEGDLSISVPLAFDSFQSSVGPVQGSAFVNFNSCDPGGLTPCPPFFSTSDGDLTFTSFIADTGSASMVITSPTPEPSTFLLLSTGLLGLGILAKRFSLA